jgi:ABC-type polysaccharide/polyol phosphate transport system ATPase subunit
MTFPIASDGLAGPAAAADDDAVLLDLVSVRYRLALEAPLTIKETLLRRRRRRTVEHLALDAVTLRVRRAETLGIIGRNGAGKTTLLNVMARIIPPSEGRLRIRGAVSPLIDLSGGFHPELTGRENVYLRGALLGVRRRDMQPRIDGIAEFAAIGQFFDAPLRTYSTGMLVRLAFAVATSVDAAILLVDEALAVGDAEFQQKCAARMQSLRAQGVTFVVVSHDVASLGRTCDRLLWLDGGRPRALGMPDDVVAQYAASYGVA